MPVRLLLAQAWYFYPRPPRGGRPLLPSMAARARAISIHALREEGDFLTCRVYNMHKNFYPRPPRGGRQQFPLFWLILLLFLSTPSARRATNLYRFIADFCVISIHALREEGDDLLTAALQRASISIHALREEGDLRQSTSLHPFFNFYPRPPRGGRPFRCCATGRCRAISIHALREEGDSKNRDKISIFKQIIQHSARI